MDGMLGTYRIVKKLGEGGMGAVYLAEHALLGRRAAVKVLQPALSANQDIVQRFFNEARAATAIADPGIVQIFDFGYHTDGSAYIVMEFLEGEALDARLRRFGRLAPDDALRILRQVSASLAAAHSRGIVHRDLKPENIFLVPDREVVGGERAKILDFGIAKLTNDSDSKIKTQTAAIMGTPTYMSPEQCRGAGYVDHRSDIYSLGCVLFHLIVGRPPFEGEGVGEIIASHLREPAPIASTIVPGVSPALDGLLARCLAKPADARFATATELAEACGALIGAGPAASHPGLAASMAGHAAAPGTGVGAVTTLSGAAGAAATAGATAAPTTGGSKRGLAIALGAVGAVAAGVIAIVVASSGGKNDASDAPKVAANEPAVVTTPTPTPNAPTTPDPTAAPAPTPAAPTPAPTPPADPPPAVATEPTPTPTPPPTKPSTTRPSSSRRDTPPKDAPAPAADPAALVEAASSAAVNGQFAMALKRAEEALAAGATGATKAKATAIAALSACNARKDSAARKYYAMVSSSQRSALRQVCLRNGITLPDSTTTAPADPPATPTKPRVPGDLDGDGIPDQR